MASRIKSLASGTATSHQRVLLPALLSLCMAGIGSTVMPATAAAATNGQQISFCSEDPLVSRAPGGYAVVTGTNQHGKTVTSHKIKLRGGGNCENLKDWWYKGIVTIKWHDHKGAVRATTRCAVPTVKNSNWIDCDDIPIHTRLVRWLSGEIAKNVRSPAVAEMQHLNRQGFLKRDLAKAAWYRWVRPGGPWDHKSYLARQFGGRAYALDRGLYWFLWNDRYLLSYDIWSNFHYGYVGRVAGFSAGALRLFHQLKIAGRTDAGDRLTVEMGIEFYDKYGSGATPERIAEFLTQHLAQLRSAGEVRAI